MLFHYKPFERIPFISKYFYITTLVFVIARNCATELSLLKHALQHDGNIITDFPINQQIPYRQPIKPIVALPFDLKQFHAHINNDWTTYSVQQQIRPSTPLLNVTPDCSCYNYYEINWQPDQWTSLIHDSSRTSFDFETVHLKLINKKNFFIPHIQNKAPLYNMSVEHSNDALLFTSYVISYFYEKFESVRFKLFHNIKPWRTKHSGPCFV